MIIFDGANTIYTDSNIVYITEDNCPIFHTTEDRTSSVIKNYIIEVTSKMEVDRLTKLVSFASKGDMDDRLINGMAKLISSQEFLMRPVISDGLSMIGLGYIDEQEDVILDKCVISGKESLREVTKGVLCSINNGWNGNLHESVIVKAWKVMEKNSIFVNKLKYAYTITHSEDDDKYCNFAIKTFK